jgi:RNA polymerase sigma-B factor
VDGVPVESDERQPVLPPSDPQPSRRSGWLLRRYARTQDPRDLEELVARFRPLARRLALRYARGGEPLDDLEQVANLGLVKALQRFDPDKGFAFTSFAVPTILGELKRSFRDSAWSAHVPRSMQERSARVREATERLETEHGRPPTVSEIATRLGCEDEEVLEAMSALGALSSVSFDAPSPEEGLTVGDRIGGEDGGYELAEDLAAIQAALPTLSDIQRQVLELRFGEDLKQSEIAREVGVSQMQVSRLLRAAVDRLSTVAEYQSRPHRAAA